MKLRKGLFCHRPVIALFFFTFLVDGWAQTIETNSTDCGLFFAIPDASCTASSNYAIDVQNAPGSQLGADVLLEEIRLIIEHDWVGDLEISLTSPSGVRIPLSLKNGRGGQNYGDPTSPACTAPTIFSRRACTSIQNAVPPFIGTFLPEGNLNDFNDGSNPLGNWILQVCDVQADNTGWVQFVELVFSDNICQPPTDVSIRSISASGVELFWSSANTSCTDFIVEYGPPGFQPDSAGTSSDGFIQVVPCTAGLPFLLTGLEEFSTYDLYVRQLCGADVYSPNSCQLQFTTDCLPPPPSLEETFDAQNPCGRSCADDCNLSGSWYNVSTDDQDWLVNRGATTSSKTGPSDDISGGGQYIYTEASNRECPLASLTELRSNCLMIDTSQSNCHLSFFYHMYGSETGSLQLEASIDGGQNWVLLWILSGDQGDQWFRQFIDLGFFHDRVVQFRFVATRGTSFKSDIALDQISFYGAQDLGTSLFQYFLDLDGDGFGDPNEPISSCVPNIPPNYVSNALDCDDALFEINPSAAEILCNGLDENCNGMADDTFIPAPRVEEVRVCQGEQAVLNVSTPAAGAYYWYAAPTATQAIATGPQLNLGLVSTSGFYYLVDSLDAGCSSERQAIQLIVRPIPILSSNENPAVCFGERFDLATLDINDDNLTGGRLRYFARDPSSGADSLSSSSVQILSDTSFYIQSITDFGCSDVIVMDFKVHELPGIEISPAADQLICANGSTILTAIPGTSGTPPYELSWSNGSNRSRIRANAALPGSQTTHSVRITDANGCQQADSIQVETLASITAIAINEVKDVSDCNGADGLIRLEPANGLAPYDYQWNGPVVGSLSGQTSETTLNNLRQGSYRITISDQSGANCSLILPVVLINGPSVVVDTNIVIEPTSCPNSSDGSIDINILSGNPNFLWSNGATTEDISQLPSAKYSVTISEGTCVNVLNDLFVGSPDTLDIILMDQQSVSCKDGTDGLLAVAVSGGTPPYQYTWSNGRTEALVDGLSAGLYDLTVTDDNSCSAVLSAVEVTEPASLGISVNQIRMPACFGALNGAVDVSVDGGTEPYVYSWSDASNMEDATGLGLGTYQLTVTDANNCQLVSEAIVLMEPGELSIDAFIQAASCNGVNDGRIDLTVSGGTMPYTYQWSNGAMSKDLAELESGVYHLTLTDANGCRKEFDDFEIEAPGLIGFDRIAIQEPACPGIDDGFILFSIKGGTAPYEYNWSDGERQKDRMGLGKGDYVLTVTDANGCVFVSDTIDLDFLVPLEYVLSFSSDISCSGRSDGSVLITPLWNAQGFSYQWNNGDTQAFIDGLSKGAYVCTITGAAGCILVTDTIEIQEPDPLDVVVANLEDASCHSLADGNIDVIVSGGRTPYEYSWNTGATTEDLGQVRAGNYSLTIRDSSNCGYTSDIIRVDEPDPLAVDIVNIINVGCAGSANGSIEIQVRGGNEPYDIQWETGDTSLLLSKLSPDKYDLTITDANSCQLIEKELEVRRLPDSLEVPITAFQDVSCFGAFDGQITPGPLDGQGPYQYNWSNGATDSLNQNLGPGTYDLTITDANGCVGTSDRIIIQEPEDFAFRVLDIGGLSCASDSTGFIEVEISGGVPPYEYNWGNGGDRARIENLKTGIYQLTITDAQDCTFSPDQAIRLSAPNPLRVDSILQSNVNCFGDSTASIRLLVTGGQPQYRFEWNTGDSISHLSNLGAGTYQCRIIDSLGCEIFLGDIEILQPTAQLQVAEVLQQASAYCEPTGSIELSLSGGTRPYTYFWNTGDTTAQIDQLEGGIYTCFVEDANNCLLETLPIELPEQMPFVLDYELEFASGGGDDGQITAIVSGGRPPYDFQWDANAGNQMDSIAVGLSNGWYALTITDADGCVEVDSIRLDPTVSTSQPKSTRSWQVFPNPTDGKVQLRLVLDAPYALEFRLYNVVGQRIRTQWRSAADRHHWGVDLNELPEGIYWINVQLETGERLLQKVVFQR